MSRGARPDVLGPGDGPRLRALRRRALAADPDAFYRTAAEEAATTAESWERAVTDPGTRWLVAVRAGVDVALACTRPGHPPDEAVPEVVSVWVDPAARGHGLARAMVVDLVEHARATGRTAVTLWLASGNASAAALYASLGFTPTGRTGAFPPPRDIPEHELRLELDG